MQYPDIGQTFNCLDVAAFALHRQMGTGLDGLAIDIDSAGPSMAGLATNMRPCQVHFFT
jgi:hypothetical protein